MPTANHCAVFSGVCTNNTKMPAFAKQIFDMQVTCPILLWPPYVIGADIVFLPCDLYLLSFFFFSSPNLSGRRLDVYHTSTHGVTLV